MNTDALRENYGTLSETIKELAAMGYTHDFNIQGDCLVCHKSNITLSPSEFQIDKIYRFEGASDPDYQSILYAISAIRHNLKGVLVDGYGISSGEFPSKLIEKLRMHTGIAQQRNKANEATQQRPGGDRLLDAPLVQMNLDTFMQQIRRESTWEESERNAMTIFKSAQMRIVLIGLHEKASLPSHTANGVISVQVLEGKITFSVEGVVQELEKGQMVALHENIVHSVKALTESFILLTVVMERT